MSHPIYPCLWFDNQAEEAANYYCSVFKNSKIIDSSPIVINFDLDGRKFMALNGGPQFKPNEAISFVVNCDTQDEIDYYWTKLTDGGKESMCGWLRDRYGVSWQIVPAILGKLMSDSRRSQRVMQAFMKMKKFDIQKLLDA